jgi:hypothetical protein
MDERRYSEDEVAAIFASATDVPEPGRRPLETSAGMTLQELQEIGREVGIPADAVAAAARALERRGAQPVTRGFLGLPIGVGRTVELGRRMSDEEWERLVVDLRETFDARGHVSAHGSFRQWTNGNLQALLEPSGTGHRLRLQTLKGGARSMIITGLALLGAGAATTILSVLRGSVNDPGSLVAMAVGGLGLIAAGTLQVPSWARLRARQMEGVIERLLQATSARPRSLPESSTDRIQGP